MTIVLPDHCAPKPVAQAAEQLETAQAGLDDARRERQSREAAVAEAETLDRQALADRLIQDAEARPDRTHRDRAEAELAEAVEIEQACASNLEAASERAASLTFEHLDAWTKAVEQARTKADATFARAVAKLREAEAARAELRGVAVWLKQLQHSGRSWLVGGASGTIRPASGATPLPGRLDVRDPRNADAKLSVAYALELLDGYARESSVEGERRAEQERAERAQAAEAHQRRMQEARAGAIQPR